MPGPVVAPEARFDPLHFLVQRTTQGFTLEAYRQAKQLGYSGFLEWQLDHERIDDRAMDKRLAKFDTLAMTPFEMFQAYFPYGSMGDHSTVPRQLKAATLLRSIYSRRQLYERMVQFWSEHFSVFHFDAKVKYLKTVDDRDVIRKHALGKFPDLLKANAHSPAMLWYLDNYINSRYGPNENYARELMELHTLGVEGPFTESDVEQVARCLTGWRVRARRRPNMGEFYFDASVHDPGRKVVLGVKIPPNGGKTDGDIVLDLLAYHPSTARHIATKMTRWLLSYRPPTTVIDRVTDTYLRTGGDIKAMIRSVLSARSLWETEVHKSSQRKFRRPYHLLVALLRASRAELGKDLYPLLERLEAMGHSPFHWVAPNGPPDHAEAWSASLVARWNFASDLLANRLPEAPIEWKRVFAQVGGLKAKQIVHQIDLILTGGFMRPEDRSHVRKFFAAQSQITPKEVLEGLALAASSPSYQLY